MKKLLLTATALAALSLLAPNFSHAQAVTDPAGNGHMGVYLNNGDGLWNSCVSGIATGSHVQGWIVYLAPATPVFTQSRGFEAGVDLILPGKDSQITSFFSITYPQQTIDVGVNNLAAGTYNYIAGYSSPISLGLGTVLGTLDLFFLEATGTQIDIHLRASIPPSLPIVTTPMVMDMEFDPIAVNMIQDGDIVAQVNAPACTVVLPTEEVSWGAVKSLFR